MIAPFGPLFLTLYLATEVDLLLRCTTAAEWPQKEHSGQHHVP